MTQKMTPEELKKAILMDVVKQIPIDKGFKVPDGFPIPLNKQLFVKRLHDSTAMQSKQIKTDTGEAVQLLIASSANTIIPDTAIIYACGPQVTDFLFPGQMVMLNPFAQIEIMFNGDSYIHCHESDINGILPPKTHVYAGVHSEEYMRRSKSIGVWNGYYKRKAAHDNNELDVKIEKEKKVLKKKR